MAGPLVAAAGAAAAYRAVQGLGAAANALAQSPAGQGFGAALERAVGAAIETGRAADTQSNAALSGQGGVTDVVLAISRAELALQTATAVRDRVVTAYQDVMRMPI
ncbi:MAG: flagellar hook-basal body complex protein FliE [Rubritepida sp.]|jgi:flagellar hook-basal body complex protein FliE|nr:flagellar hook-basal body complex protein FliE [Rubritepida sp.]MCU0944470.1 flagellar hook-basal body complex protein FliE [Rubritepida sp.]